MTAEKFEDELRQLIRREPFCPFVVELVDGRRIEIDHPHIVFGGGAASFLTPDYDLVEFACEEVREFRSAAQGTAK